MNKLLASLCIALLSPVAHADVMTVNFTTHGGWGMPRTTVDSVGSLTLTLNEDGTVGASLDMAADQAWYGAGIDTGREFGESNFSQGGAGAWSTSFGGFDTGVSCNQGCIGPASWTIGAGNDITSVQQLFAGMDSTYDAWFYTSTGEYAGVAAMPQAAPPQAALPQATDPGNVPEPATISLLGLGLAGVGIARRRRIGSAKRA